MEIKKVIHYLLIGNLISGKVIYEMSNIFDPKTLYEANLIFSNFQKKKRHSQNTKINSFTVSIYIDNIIMIIKTDDLYPIEHNFELFKKIRNAIPNLYDLSIDWSLNLYKQSIGEKITKIINEYFSDLNSSRRALNTVSFSKNDINDIIEEESDENKKESSVSSKNSFKKEKRNSLISNSTYGGNNKKGKRGIFFTTNNDAKKISVKMIDDDEEENKNNIFKSLVQSSSLIKIDNNNNKNELNKSKISLRESQMTNKYVNDLKNIVSNISCCKRVIIFFIILVIIILVVAIPLIIKFSYSY